MRVVAIDASERGWVEWSELELPRCRRVRCAAGPAANLEAAAPQILAGAPGRDPQAIVVVTGPGSLTGIRIAVAAALGVGMALAIPVYGVGALEVAALAGRPGAVVAVRPAGRGGLWVARYRQRGGGLDELEPPSRVDAATWHPPDGIPVARIAAWPGPGEPIPAGASRPLAAAARLAVTRAPLDLASFDPATGLAVNPPL